MKYQYEQEPECCPKFEPIPWDDKSFEWKEKLFIKDKVCTLFYMPLNFGKVMKRLDEKLTKADAKMSDNLCLSDHTSKWNMDIYMAVDKKIPEAENVTLTGKYFSKVYEGPFSDTEKWMKEFENTTKNKGLSIKKKYTWYTTCPKCAKKYGKNYVVLVGQLE